MEALNVVVLAPDAPPKALLESALRDLPVRVVFEPWAPVDWDEFLERLVRIDAGAVLVDYDHFEDDFADIVARVKSIRPPAPAVIAVSLRPDSQVEDDARRAGADKVVRPPVERKLGQVLEEAVAQRLASKSINGEPGRLLGVAGVRGGCGTSTITCLLALALRRVTGQPVLLADLDPGGGMIAFLTEAHTPYSLLDAAASIHRLDANYWGTLAAAHPGGIDVIPGPADPTALRSADLGRVRRVLTFLRTRYAWLVADLGEIWDGIWVELREELDQLWVIATPGAPGLYQARRALQRLRATGLQPAQWRLLVNFAGRPAVTADEIESLVGRRPDAWMPEVAELAESELGLELLGLRGRAGDRMLRLAARLAGVAEARTAPRLNLPQLRLLRREPFVRLIPRL